MVHVHPRFDDWNLVACPPSVRKHGQDDPHGQIPCFPRDGWYEGVSGWDFAFPEEECWEEEERDDEGCYETCCCPAVGGAKGQTEDEEEDGREDSID